MSLQYAYGDEQNIFATPETFIPNTPKIIAALKLAKQAHKGQFRKTGEPFFYHSIAVAQILESWGLGKDEDLVVAALLHDVPEDNANIELRFLRREFGAEVARLVDGVTKVDNQTSRNVNLDTLKKISKRSYLEPKVALIKIADRLHNMRTLYGVSKEKQVEKSAETLEIYAKLAQSLGLWLVKKELEDLSFMYLEPDCYWKTKIEVDADKRVESRFLNRISSLLNKMLNERDMDAKIAVRINGYWALYQKRIQAQIKGKTLSSRGFFDINDLVSFRVIVKDLDSCYRFLGVVHEKLGEYVDFSRFDEFIGVNKRINGYSAIQTTLNFPEGATEIAIATEEMEQFNKKGVISLLERGDNNLEDFTLKSVFSDEGKILFLPKKATGVDYVYSISPRIGANARAIVINGKINSLKKKIPNAATVKIIIGKTRRSPGPDYLKHCLPSTKVLITEQLNLAGANEFVLRGKAIAEEILAPYGILRFEDLGLYADELVFDYMREDVRDIYLMLGSGAISSSQIIRWLNAHEISKQKLGITTIKLTGSDRIGILSDLTKWISEKGGNIKNISLKTINGKFLIIIVVDSLSKTGEDVLRNKFSYDRRFESWKVV